MMISSHFSLGTRVPGDPGTRGPGYLPSHSKKAAESVPTLISSHLMSVPPDFDQGLHHHCDVPLRFWEFSPR
eukprot:2896767-Rhodomonas_salina.1